MGPYITPPVSAPSSPSPPPPHQLNGAAPSFPPHSHLSFAPSIPRTVGTRPNNKPPTPPLAKTNLASSTVITRNDSPVQTNNDQAVTSSTPKPKLNPNASSFMPVVKSPAIVTSTPTPPPRLNRAVTPPSKPRTHPFNPLSSQFNPSPSPTPTKEDESNHEKGAKFNPAAPAFVPPATSRPSPPPNAPTGPAASRVPRTNPPPDNSSLSRPYSKLPLSPPTGPKADANKMPPPPNIGLGIGMGAANEIGIRGLPPTTPLGPRAMTSPTGPRALSRHSSTRESHRSRDSYDSRDGHHKHGHLKPQAKPQTKPQPVLPTVAITRIPGIEKPVPTGPAAMLKDIPPAGYIEGVPTAPAAMLKEKESMNGSDDGRGRSGRYSKLSRFHSHRTRSWISGTDSRNESRSRDGSVTPSQAGSELAMEKVAKTEDIPPVSEEPEVAQETTTVELKNVAEVENVPVEEVETPVMVVAPSSVEAEKETIGEQVVEVEPEVKVEKGAEVSEVGGTEVIETGIKQEVAVPAPEVIGAETEATGPKAEEAEVEVTLPVTLAVPLIQLELPGSSPQEVVIPEFPSSTRAATTPSSLPRLSELSMQKREKKGWNGGNSTRARSYKTSNR
ncbi:hypothetical protein BDZ91DRAFT_241909 [Kalaharituber pfeilii]|nr:hypothetical protein BDZ91DRAFT_241909 [Kalaharituber pfeilii]